ncbi:hypothetical protein N431DRAFT_496881 [Stipitochalara longipes BDJ]|nr:hypothetical protein N431DRAFT_496881 [Stipitochalara longipes BDJ]
MKISDYATYSGKTNTNLFLKINGYISYINRTETSPNKELYYKVVDKLDDKGKVTSSREEPISPELGTLKSIILINNNERFKNKDEPNELYTTITSTFRQSTLELIGRYFNKIINNNYNSFNNINKYISLPSLYNNYTSYKYKELSMKEGRLNSNTRLEANKTSFNNSPSYYKYYNKKGYIEDKYYTKYPELRNNISSSNSNSKNKNNKDNNKTYKKGYKNPKVLFKKK